MAEQGKGRRSDSLLRFSLGAFGVLAGAYAWARLRENRLLAEAEGLAGEEPPKAEPASKGRAKKRAK